MVNVHQLGNYLKILMKIRKNIVLPNHHISELNKYLFAHGYSPEHEITIYEKLSFPDEQLYKLHLVRLNR